MTMHKEQGTFWQVSLPARYSDLVQWQNTLAARPRAVGSHVFGAIRHHFTLQGSWLSSCLQARAQVLSQKCGVLCHVQPDCEKHL
jgi:hypothetical protein